MKITIDEKSGFCFGVIKAIQKAEELLDSHDEVYSLGDIVHNHLEINRLGVKGLHRATHDDFTKLSGKTLLIRAHGEPPTTYARAAAANINLVDATCPVVAQLQKRVAKAWAKMQPINGQLLILGKPGHAEVVGLTGQIDERTIVIENIEDLAGVDFTRPIYFLSQTTQSLDLFETIKNEIIRQSTSGQVNIDDTICRQVSNRIPHLQHFATEHQVVIFASGKKSSNGQALFEACHAANALTYKVESQTELQPEWFRSVESVGICGATSTPRWVMEQIADYIEQKWGNK